MIRADMGFFEIVGLAVMIAFAIFGVISFTITLFRVMNEPEDYVEDDEWEIADWQDRHKAIES